MNITLPKETLPLRVPRALVCKLRGCSTRTVLRAEQRGELVPYRLNSRVVLYTRESVIRWLNLQPEEVQEPTAKKSLILEP